MIPHRIIVALASISTLVSVLLTGCNSTPPRRERPPSIEVLQVRNHVGGTHERTVVHEGFWYQTFGTSVLAIDPTTNEELAAVRLGEVGRHGPITDLCVVNGRLFALMEDEAVVEMQLNNPRRPYEISRREVAELGVTPHRFCVVTTPLGEDDLYICGRDGVARWSDGHVFLRGEGEVKSVAPSAYGLVATIGRRVHRLSNGEYVGSASTLHAMPGQDALVFTRESAEGTLIGMMSPEIREMAADDGVRAVSGPVRSMRVFHDRVWAVADDRILVMQPQNGGLVAEKWIRVRGARDVAPISENYLAVAGSFGRAVYRIESDQRGPADTFVFAHREASQLQSARTDGRYVLAGSPEGAWLYLIGSRAELVDRPLDAPALPSRSAATSTAEAMIEGDGETLTIQFGNRSLTYREPGYDVRMHTIEAIDGHFWVGHDRGITVLHADASFATPGGTNQPADGSMLVRDRLRLHGPVRFLYPLPQGGGAAYVAQLGGFGTAEYREISQDEQN